MRHVLDAVERERAELRALIEECERRLGRLDEIEKLADVEELAPTPVAKPAPKQTPAPSKPVQLTRALPPARRTQAQPKRLTAGQTVAAQVLAAIKDQEPASKGAIQRAVSASYLEVDKAVRHLIDTGLVRKVGERAGSRYHLTATLDRQVAERNGKHNRDLGAQRSRCRDDVLRTIRSEPGMWSEARLAAAGAWDRELIAEVCGALLEADEVLLNTDGTYSPAMVGAVA